MFESLKYNLDENDNNYDIDIDFLKAGCDKDFDKVLENLNQFSDDVMLNSNPRKLQAQVEKYEEKKINLLKESNHSPLKQQIHQNDNFLPEWQSELEYEKSFNRIDKLYDKIMERRHIEKPLEKERIPLNYEQMYNQQNPLLHSDELMQKLNDQGGFNYPTITDADLQYQNCQVNAPILIPLEPQIQIQQPIPYQNQYFMQPNIIQANYEINNQQYPVGIPINNQNYQPNYQNCQFNQQGAYYGQPGQYQQNY